MHLELHRYEGDAEEPQRAVTVARCHPLLLWAFAGWGAPRQAEAALGTHGRKTLALPWGEGKGPRPKATDRHQGWTEDEAAGVPGVHPSPRRPPSTWLSTWNWISSSMLATLHTLTLPSSLHVAQWDSLGLKTTSFTCEESPPYLRPMALEQRGNTAWPGHS